MKLKASEIIKNLRNELKLSQEDFAELINKSTRQLSRIENDKADLHILDIVDIMIKCGKTTSDLSSLVLESKDYSLFRQFTNATRAYTNARDWERFDEAIAQLGERYGKDHPFIGLLKARAEQHADDHMEINKAVALYTDALPKSIEGFSEENVENYLLRGFDLFFIGEMAELMRLAGDTDKALQICQALLNNKSLKSQQKNNGGTYYPYLTYQYLNACLAAGMYNEALTEATKLHSYLIQNNQLLYISHCLRIMAESYFALGEDASMYKLSSLRAYHWAPILGLQWYTKHIIALCEKYGVDVNEDNIP